MGVNVKGYNCTTLSPRCANVHMGVDAAQVYSNLTGQCLKRSGNKLFLHAEVTPEHQATGLPQRDNTDSLAHPLVKSEFGRDITLSILLAVVPLRRIRFEASHPRHLGSS